MISIQRFADLGALELPWLSARYHFSFMDYQNPERMGVGKLRVLNDDTVKAHGGFGMHPHENMEIITYVREGTITHRDNLGHEGHVSAGNVQVMSAGSGIIHSEKNEADKDMTLFQIWIEPNISNVAPRWENKQFPKEHSDQLQLLVSGRKEDENSGALFIYQEASIAGGKFIAGKEFTHKLRSPAAYLVVSYGHIQMDGQDIYARDGIEIRGEDLLTIKVMEECEIILVEVPE